MPADVSVRMVVALASVLREAGVAISPERTALAVAGLDRIDLGRPDDVYWTLRQTLVSRRDDLVRFDERLGPQTPASEQLSLRSLTELDAPHAGNADDGSAEAVDPEPLPGWTAKETLRTKDFARATADELEALESLIAELQVRRPPRRSRRLERTSHRDRLDLRRTLRASTATGGDLLTPVFRRRADVPRSVVLLCDISGSMATYARPLLLFGHGLIRSGKGVEVFTFGTRLTRLTRLLASRDPDRALASATGSVADWSGGTRIGASLHHFNNRFGKHAVARGSVVIIASDGWEREDPGLVASEMARLSRAAYAVIWVNPCKGDPAYEPLAAGMRAALPHVDRFLSGHTLAGLEELGEVLAEIRGRHAAAPARVHDADGVTG